MKKLIILLLVLVLYSCDDGDVFTTTPNASKPYIVEEINRIKTMNTDNIHFCRYSLSTYTGYIYYVNHITVEDSIGKFAIGDTVRFELKMITKTKK